MKFEVLLGKFLQKSQEESLDEDYNIKIATAVLFIELAYADFNVSNEEKQLTNKSLSNFFELSDEEVNELLNTASKFREERNDIWFFTHQIKENFSHARKIKIIELLWQLVFADGTKDKFEEALMRKITNLIGLSHGDMINAKIKAQK